MTNGIKIFAIVLCAVTLFCSCGRAGSEPPTEVVEVLDQYFNAAVVGDMRPAMELIEPAWVEEQAAGLNMDVGEYKTMFADMFNEELGDLGLTSYTFKKKNKVSDTEWEIDVYQTIAKGTSLETFNIVKVWNRWYIAGKNFE